MRNAAFLSATNDDYIAVLAITIFGIYRQIIISITILRLISRIVAAAFHFRHAACIFRVGDYALGFSRFHFADDFRAFFITIRHRCYNTQLLSI